MFTIEQIKLAFSQLTDNDPVSYAIPFFVIFILIRIFMIFRSFCLHDILLYYMSVLGPFLLAVTY